MIRDRAAAVPPILEKPLHARFPILGMRRTVTGQVNAATASQSRSRSMNCLSNQDFTRGSDCIAIWVLT